MKSSKKFDQVNNLRQGIYQLKKEVIKPSIDSDGNFGIYCYKKTDINANCAVKFAPEACESLKNEIKFYEQIKNKKVEWQPKYYETIKRDKRNFLIIQQIPHAIKIE